MMKSYRNWQRDEHFRKEVLPIVIHEMQEWSIWNPLGGRAMGQEERGEMERFGKMLGYNKSWYNIFSQDQRHGGDNMMTQLQKIGAMQDDTAKADALTKLMNSGMKMGQNAPFKQAYDALNKIKQTVNQVDKGNLNHNDVQLLMRVLVNAHKQGNIPFRDLNMLWRNVTGIMNQQGQTDPQAAQLAKGNDVHTPLHLLKMFFGIGGGIFSSPNNIAEIKDESAKILRQVYPDEFQQLYHAKFGTSPPGMGQGAGFNVSGAGSLAPNAANAGVDPQIIDGLQQALQFQNDPQKMAQAIQTILQKLSGGAGAAPPPPPPK